MIAREFNIIVSREIQFKENKKDCLVPQNCRFLFDPQFFSFFFFFFFGFKKTKIENENEETLVLKTQKDFRKKKKETMEEKRCGDDDAR